MRIETAHIAQSVAQSVGADPTGESAVPATAGRPDGGSTGWSDEEIARLRSEWGAEPGHR